MKQNIGTHNSLTYTRPRYWVFNLFRPFYQCQSMSIYEQVDAGIRTFDIRVRQNNKGVWVPAHGMVEFKYDIHNILQYLNNTVNECRVRLIWEIPKYKPVEPFVEFCENAKNTYTNIQFFEGRRKYDWECCYNFNPNNNGSPSLITEQYVGSMQSWYGKICPWLWTLLHRKRSRALAGKSEAEVALLDFVHDDEKI